MQKHTRPITNGQGFKHEILQNTLELQFEKDNQEKRKKIRIWWENLPANIKIICLILFLVGALLIAIAIIIINKHYESLGHLLLILGCIFSLHAIESLIHHYFLHQKFVD